MGEAGWKKVPMNLQDLPHKLMGTAWWHPEEEVIAVDARSPNFKLTEDGGLSEKLTHPIFDCQTRGSC